VGCWCDLGVSAEAVRTVGVAEEWYGIDRV
jgi:hypothetical protein